ncbi:MBL fold metallo-hydrolase [Amycolatopsis ultiminotia]|uniref:MBL fold metallo-hydrolase n=1 Tax=Amycolatopsis ultiminotia TaxID=543629 RepID=A0ABP6V3R8_9PSEU
MRLTHFGHSCLLMETTVQGGATRVLFDPGTYSRDFEDLRNLNLVLITHGHPDHLDADRVRALAERNPEAAIVHSPGAAAALDGLSATAARPGDKLTVDGVDITVTGSGKHATIHPDLTGADNNGYLVDGVLLHPGDALDAPEAEVDVLLVPVGAPWLKIRESIDYVRTVRPGVVVPIHQAGLAEVHQRMHYALLRDLAPSGTEVVVLDHATPYTV